MPTPRGSHLSFETKRKISLAKRRLCPDIKRIETLYCQEGYSLEEIAVIFRCNRRLLKIWLFYSLIAIVRRPPHS